MTKEPNQTEQYLKSINPNFDGYLYIVDNYMTPPNNWTRIPFKEILHRERLAVLRGKVEEAKNYCETPWEADKRVAELTSEIKKLEGEK